MWILAWTIKGCLDEVDLWALYDTEAEALIHLEELLDNGDLRCWAIAPVKIASEPHWIVGTE